MHTWPYFLGAILVLIGCRQRAGAACFKVRSACSRWPQRGHRKWKWVHIGGSVLNCYWHVTRCFVINFLYSGILWLICFMTSLSALYTLIFDSPKLKCNCRSNTTMVKVGIFFSEALNGEYSFVQGRLLTLSLWNIFPTSFRTTCSKKV